MVVAEQYMAGRLEDAEFHAPSRYTLAKNKFPGHVKLVEFFTNATKPETGGMQLAFQALDEYFEGAVALIGYHLDDPMHSEAAASRLKYYRGAWAPLAVFDGKSVLSLEFFRGRETVGKRGRELSGFPRRMPPRASRPRARRGHLTSR